MLFSDSSYAQIFRTILSDGEKVEYRFRKGVDLAIKTLASTHGASDLFTQRYTIPSTGNTYVLFWRIASGSQGLFCKGDSCITIKDRTGRNLYFYASKMKDYKAFIGKAETINLLQVYDAHFLSRYRERMNFGNRVDTDKLIARFIGNNASRMVESDMKEFNLRHEQLREVADYRPYQCRDGVCFSSVSYDNLEQGKRLVVIKHNTFVPCSMLFEQQKKSLLPSHLSRVFFNPEFKPDFPID